MAMSVPDRIKRAHIAIMQCNDVTFEMESEDEIHS